jgi:hypothetical protein
VEIFDFCNASDNSSPTLSALSRTVDSAGKSIG